MDPSRATKELLELLGEGLHVLRTHSPSYIKFRRDLEDMQEIFTALVLLTEGLRQEVYRIEGENQSGYCRDQKMDLKASMIAQIVKGHK